MWKYYLVAFSIIILVSSIALLYVRSNVSVQSEESKATIDIIWQDSERLQRKIEKTLIVLMQGIEIPLEDKKQIKNELKSINLRHSAENDRIVEFFKKMGKKTIPEIEVGLRSEKIEIRKKETVA